MTTLEAMAKKRFEEYVKSRKGDQAVVLYDWRQLSKKRKMDWIAEVYHTSRFVVEHWQSKIGNSVGKLEGTPTSFMMGFHKGLEKERIRNINILKEVELTLQDEYMGLISGELEL